MSYPVEATYKFLGPDKDSQELSYGAFLEDNSPPKSMQPNEDDDHVTAANKERNWKLRQAQWKKECEASVKEAASDFKFGRTVKLSEEDPDTGLPQQKFVGHTFPKGEPTKVKFGTLPAAEASYLYAKLESFCSRGLFERCEDTPKKAAGGPPTK